jgi:hypothetical protein
MQRSFLLVACLCSLPDAAGAADAVDYTRDIKPILKERCFACHGALKQKAKLRLDTAAAMRKGGRHGPAIVPGQAARSLLLQRVSATDESDRMPPDGKPLTQMQIALLRKWIQQGASSPASDKPDADPCQHWAYRLPVRAALPRLKQAAWMGNPIDAFIGVEHERRGLRANPPADRAALLRRVYLDLIGLPPTRAELRAFQADPSANAYEKVVDRLLASPQHGERWARHWMDVWRYSDWYGRRAVPDVWNSAPQVWRWRDWIVRSLNADHGYDRMVGEMLAADEIAPEDDEAAVATGYLVRNWYALNPNQWMRDTVEHTGKAFLGLTLNCAHCHDHKYDPISQEEYFRFRAFFEPLQLRQDRVRGEPDPGPFQKYDYSVLRKVVLLGRVAVFDERLDAKTYMYHMGDERNRFKDRPPIAPGAPAFLGGDRLKIEPIDLPPAAWYPGIKPFVQQEEIARREQAVAAARAALDSARRALALSQAHLREAQTQLPAGRIPPAVVASARRRFESAVTAHQAGVRLAEARLALAEAERKAILARIVADKVRYLKEPGNFDELAQRASKAEHSAALCAAQEKVVRAEQALAAVKSKGGPAAAIKGAEQRLGVARNAVEAAGKALAAKSNKYTPLSPLYPARSTGRRRALAGWIASKDNPLTARVAVNHIWKWHFGRPLVDTVFDLGRNGKKPSHPELLDWLAVEFMESGWSMKHLHRLIVTSAAYRMQSSTGKNRASLLVDPDNRWLWRFERRRIEAEVVRDAILHTAGELDTRLGGPPLDTSAGETSRRRSLYFTIHPEGDGHPGFLELFDAPDPCDCYRRSESIVPQQALALTNSRLLLDHSRLLAGKMGTGSDDVFIIAAFEQVLSRRPSAQEQDVCRAFLYRQADLFRKARPAELKTTAGGVPPAVEPGMRARESLIRVLFSHEDFIAIR